MVNNRSWISFKKELYFRIVQLVVHHSHPGIQFINRAIGFNAQVALWYFGAANKSRVSAIAGFCINFRAISKYQNSKVSCKQVPAYSTRGNEKVLIGGLFRFSG